MALQLKQKGFLPTLAISATVSAIIVTCLFVLMKSLISKDYETPDTRKTIPIPNIVQELEQIEDQYGEDDPQKIEEIEEPPPPEIQQDLNNLLNLDPLSIRFKSASLNIGLAGGIGDGDLVPISAITPIYPRRAQERGLQGYVVVDFTITTEGTTTDIRVLENAEGVEGDYRIGRGKVFESSAIKAARKLRYKPRVIDGTAVEVHNYPYKFTFTLSED